MSKNFFKEKGGVVMKFQNTLLLVAVLAIIFPVAMCYADDGYAGFELYPTPKDSPPYLYAGKGIFGDHGKIYGWTLPPNEVGLTVGPRIGPFELGAGASMGPDLDGNLEKIYTNIDLAWLIKFPGQLVWQSYSIYQFGNEGIMDFRLSRHLIWYEKFPVGLIGHNRKLGNDKAQFHWGLFLNAGKMGVFSSNRFCVAVDLRDTKSFWGAWVIDF